MSEKEYRLDVCPECRKLEGDSSEKRLFKCPSCERWFCERHLEPKLAVIRDLNKIIRDKQWRDVVEKEWKREGGHPDYAYTVERFEKLQTEKEIKTEKMADALDILKAYKKPIKFKSKQRKKESNIALEESHTSPSTDIAIIAIFVIFILIVVIVFIKS
jgi:hypothetical protein